MSFEPIFETINVNCKKFEIFEQIKADCRSEIPTEEVDKVLSVSAWVGAVESVVSNGGISYSGKIIFYISYLDMQNQLKKCECGSEFKGVIKDERITDGERADLFGVVDKYECDKSGLKLAVSSYLTVKAQVNGCSSQKVLSNGENLIVNLGEIPVVKSYTAKGLTYPIEEQYELSYPVEEVLSHRADAVITAVQCGVGAIIVDGQVQASAIMLQKTDKNDIIKENRNFPFRVEIECEDAMPNMQAVATVKEKSFKTDIAVDENSLKSVVSVSVSLSFDGHAFVEENLSVATDVFSTEQEVEVVKEHIPFYKDCEIRSVTRATTQRASVEELPVGAIVLAVGGERVEILNKDCSNENLNVSGVQAFTVFFRDGEKNVFTKKVEIPFECQLDCSYSCDTELTVLPTVLSSRARIVSISEVELESELIFTIYPKEKKQLKILCDVKPLGEKQKNDSALSVYIALEGEELWSLAKRLNVCPQELVKTNADLQFPLVGDERIVVYRQR